MLHKDKSDLKLSDIHSGFFGLSYYPEEQPRCFMERELASEAIIDRNFGTAIRHLQGLINNSLRDSGMEFSQFEGLRFYNVSNSSIRSLLLEQIATGSICLSDVSNFNDPMDPLLNVYFRTLKVSNINEKLWLKYMAKAASNLRAACLLNSNANAKGVRPEENLLMWAHYADCHKGICVKYRITPSLLEKYTKESSFLILNKIEYVDRKIDAQDITLRQSLFLKSKCWQYENEYRMVYYSLRGPARYHQIDGVEIESVYVGKDMPHESYKLFKSELSNLGIPMFKMHIKKDDLLFLQAERVV